MSLLPSAALATALPDATRVKVRSRSLSPVMKAIAFASKIGQVVASGQNLTKSMSAQELSTKKQTRSESSFSELIAESNPGPSGTQEPLQDEDFEESEMGYATVENVRGKSWAHRNRHTSTGSESPMARRPPMPLPSQDSTDGRTVTIGDSYARVSKKNVESPSIDKVIYFILYK